MILEIVEAPGPLVMFFEIIALSALTFIRSVMKDDNDDR